jgi:multicomponent Na+:H+ antiporter subunit E
VVKSRIIFFFVVLALWLVLSFAVDWPHLLVGIAVAFVVAVITGDMFVTRPHRLARPLRYVWFLYFMPLFVWECLKANLDVAYRVIHPSLPIKPGIVKVRTRLKSDTGLTFLANAITLTPGTMAVDVDRDEGVMYVHWINVRDTDTERATQQIVATFERVLERIFE